MNNPDLSIVILNYKMDGLVKNCLKSIAEHETNISKEIIVVDNGSEDDVEKFVQNVYPEALFIQTGENLGHAKGNNVGIEQAKGRYVMILNPDVVFLENVFDKVINYLDKQTKIGITTLQLRNPDGSIQQGAWKFLKFHTPLVQRSSFIQKTKLGKRHSSEFEMREWDRSSSKDVDWVQGSCMVVRKELIDEIGPFDETFFLYFTDVDWCRRCWEAGWRVHYFAEAPVIHYYHRESAQGSIIKSLKSKAMRIHIKDWLRYLAKYRTNLRPKRETNI